MGEKTIVQQSTSGYIVKDSIRSRNKNSKILKFISTIANVSMRCASVVSPVLNTRLRYWFNYGHRIHLNPPVTFIEKCNWYKLNIVIKHAIFRDCSDKLLVRDFVIKRGYGHYLNDLLCTFDDVDHIDFDILPKQFAMKLNDGAGYYIICNDKDNLNRTEVIKKMKKWWKEHKYLSYSELQNKASKRMIIVEKFINDFEDNGQPTDYKFYCFDGEPKAILTVWERNMDDAKKIFMSTDWKFLSYAYKGGKAEADLGEYPARPKDLDKMIECARALSKGFPFVRVDLYQGKENPIFGELTFTCAGAMFTAETDPAVLDMAALFKVPTEFTVPEN